MNCVEIKINETEITSEMTYSNIMTLNWRKIFLNDMS